MLVLSRKLRESIHIGDNVVVTVVEISGNKVRLGIEAPREIVVQREEVHLRISAIADTAVLVADPLLS